MRTEHSLLVEQSLLLAVLASLGLPPRAPGQYQFEQRLPKGYMPLGVGLSTLVSTNALAVGDVDGDGDLDLVHFSAEVAHLPEQVRLYLNEGQGRFTDVTASNMPAVMLPTWTVAFGDLDSDGDLDLVLGGHFAQQVYLNDGTGKFLDVTATHLPAQTATTLGLALADLDGDLDLDLVFANSWAEDRLYLNDGTGAFVDATASRLPSDPENTSAIEAVDVDGDGDRDLVFGNTGQDRLYLNDGTGRFTESTAGRMPALLDITWALDATDVDGDADFDLVTADSSLDRLYLNDGSGRFLEATADRMPQDMEETRAVRLEDFDGDGDRDVLLGNLQHNRLYLNDGSGSFADVTAERLPAPPLGSPAVAVGDVDGDADLDLVFGEELQTRLLLNDGAASFLNATPVCALLAFTRGGGGAIRAGALVDVDRDADLDALFGVDVGGSRLLQNDGRGCFTDVSAESLPGGPSRTTALAVGDVDGDGDADAVFGTATASGGALQNEIFINDGLGHFQRETFERLPQRLDETQSLALGDLDADGDLDLVVGNGSISYYRSEGRPNWLYLNNGGGVFTDVTAGRLPTRNTVTRALALGDVDGDGDLDLATGDTGSSSSYMPAAEQNALYLNNGRASFVDVTATRLPAVEDETYGLAFGDVDADGDLDLLVANQGPSRLLLNDGSGTFRDAPPGRLPTVTFARGVAFGDVDEDGDLDVAISETNQFTEVRLLLNDGSGAFHDVTGSRLPLRMHSRFVAFGDIDGDGDLDLQLDNLARGKVVPHLVNLHRQLSAPLLPILSRAYELELHAQPGYGATHSAVAVLGLSRLQPPLSIAGLGTVYVAPPYLGTPPLSIPAETGRATYSLPIPPAPSLLGVELFSQALVVDSANPSQPKLTGYAVDAIVR